MLERVRSPLYPFTKIRLPNGLRIIVKEVHATPIVAVHFWACTGSVNEPPEINGISHFFEHMFFKGTEKRGVGEMDRAIKALGGYNNAFTSTEQTAYYVVVPSEHLATASDVLYDAMRHSVFDPEEIEKERRVVEEEIIQRDDSPTGKLYDRFLALLFDGTPYAQPVLGTPETLRAIDRETFRSHLRDFYRPDHVIAVIVGDVETDVVLSWIETMTADWVSDHGKREGAEDMAWAGLPTGASSSVLPRFTFTPQTEIRTEVIEKEVNQVYWAVGFPNLGRLQLDDMYVLDVASTILGGGKSSRLYQRLVQREGLVTAVSSWIWPLSRAGAFGIDCQFPPENQCKVEQIIFEETDRVRDKRVEAAELDKAKTMLIHDFAYSNETDANIGETLGRYEGVSEAEEALTYVDRVQAVTAEQVRLAMERHCPLEAYTLCYVRPGRKEVRGES